MAKTIQRVILFRCLNCNRINIYAAEKADGRVCSECAGYIVPIDEATMGMDLSNSADFTATITTKDGRLVCHPPP